MTGPFSSRRRGPPGEPQIVATPHRQLPASWFTMIARLRREYRMTGEEIAVRLRLPRSTVAGHLMLFTA